MNFDEVFSFAHLMDCAQECMKGVKWKPSVQAFAVNQVLWVSNTLQQLQKGAYKSKGFVDFYICERGKTRHIRSVHISERMVQKCLCKFALKPLLNPTLIDTNSASQEGKGTEYAIKRLREDLRWHYARHKRRGGILIGDLHSYFDSIPHDILKQMLRKKIEDDRIYNLAAYFIDCFPGDRGIGLGSEISQVCAIYFLNKMDHAGREIFKIHGVGRYMDDFYAISENIPKLKAYKSYCEKLVASYGMCMNKNKTCITRLDQPFTWLKKRTILQPNGKIIMRLVRKNVVSKRRAIKKGFKELKAGERPIESLEQSQVSWEGYAKPYNSYRTRKNMRRLYEKEEAEWQSTLREKSLKS